MKPFILALAAAGTLAASAASAAPLYASSYPPAPARWLSPDEIRDYEEDQLERRQDMERDALHLRQKAQRRAYGLDED